MRALVRIFAVALVGCALSSAAMAQKKPNMAEPKYRYILTRLTPDGNNVWMNWSGNWDNKVAKPTRDELWLARDGKSYLVTDKKTLDEFEKAFAPKMEFEKERPKYMDGYYEARAQAKSCSREARGIDRQIAGIERRRDRADSDEERQNLNKEISDLQNQRKKLERDEETWNKKLDAETKKREQFYEKKEELRAQAYKIIDRIADDAIAKGIAKETPLPKGIGMKP